jgi:hypothetical protein
VTKFAVECRCYDDPDASAYLMDRDVDPPTPKLFDDPMDAAECAKFWREANSECDAEAVVYDENCEACAEIICKLGRFAMCEACVRIEHPELFEEAPSRETVAAVEAYVAAEKATGGAALPVSRLQFGSAPISPSAVPPGAWVADPGPGEWWIRTPREDATFSEPHRCVVTATGPVETCACWAESVDMTLDNAVNYWAEALGRDGALFAPYVEDSSCAPSSRAGISVEACDSRESCAAAFRVQQRPEHACDGCPSVANHRS